MNIQKQKYWIVILMICTTISLAYGQEKTLIIDLDYMEGDVPQLQIQGTDPEDCAKNLAKTVLNSQIKSQQLNTTELVGSSEKKQPFEQNKSGRSNYAFTTNLSINNNDPIKVNVNIANSYSNTEDANQKPLTTCRFNSLCSPTSWGRGHMLKVYKATDKGSKNPIINGTPHTHICLE